MEAEHPFDSIRKVLDAIKQETVPMAGHSDPGALVDCWRSVDDYLQEIEKECSHFAANICLHPSGDEHGHFYCTEIQSLRAQLAAKDAEITHWKGGYQAANDVLKEKEKENAELREVVKDLLPIAHARYCDLDDCEWEKEILYKASIAKARDLINENK